MCCHWGFFPGEYLSKVRVVHQNEAAGAAIAAALAGE
jgi:hypothetical protein